MDMRKHSGAVFVKVDDVRDGPIKDRIGAVVMGKYDKPDIVFESGARLSVNSTNNQTLIRAYGWNSDDWIGHAIELSLGEGEFQDKPVEMVVVKPISKSDHSEAVEPVKKAPAKPHDPMDDEVPY
jgi:hypothetical protein